MEPTLDGCHGMEWTEIFGHRDRLAWYWHRRHGRRVPLEEYVSAGNLAIAEALAVFTATHRVPWRMYLRIRIHYNMRKVRFWEAGIGNWPERRIGTTRKRAATPLYVVGNKAPEWPGWRALPCQPQGENRTYLSETLAHLEAQLSMDKLDVFTQSVFGEEVQAIATALEVTTRAIQVILVEVQSVLHAWVGIQAPGRTRHSREFIAEVQRRKAAGETYTTICAALRCSRNAVSMALAQPPVTPGAVGPEPPTAKPLPGAQRGGAVVSGLLKKSGAQPPLVHAVPATGEKARVKDKRKQDKQQGTACLNLRQHAPAPNDHAENRMPHSKQRSARRGGQRMKYVLAQCGD